MGTMISALDHPAARAWRMLRRDAPVPTKIAVLGDRQKAAVYRLDVPSEDGSAVVAKHCLTAAGYLERRIYEEILPRLPVTTLHYYGSVEEGDGTCWIFMQCAEGAHFSPALEEHRVACARWLASMHISAPDIGAAARLPDRGPSHYLEHLQSSRESVTRAAAIMSLHETDRNVLLSIIRQLDTIESQWRSIEESCGSVHPTLVHGDFRPKNVQVCIEPSGARVLVMDWETAGWGVPAADIASVRGLQSEPAGLEAYLSIARQRWPTLELDSVRRMVEVGKLFRRLAAIRWCSSSLTTRRDKALPTMKVHDAALADILEHGAISSALGGRMGAAR